MSGIPYCATEWSQIIPRLYQGGHVFRLNGTNFMSKLKGVRLFDYVVSLHQEDRASTLPDADIEHVIWEIPDDFTLGVWDGDIPKLREVVAEVVARYEAGGHVLVRCMAGYNRSGLIVALALISIGWTAEAAISQIRDKRSIWALSNPAFAKFIREHEHEFRRPS